MTEQSKQSGKHSDASQATNLQNLSGANGVDSEPEQRSTQSVTEEIARLLRGDDADAGDPPPDDPDTQESNLSLSDLKALAEHLKVDVAKLYDIEIPLSDDGGRIKLGELKDRHRDTQALETEQLRLNQRRTEIEADMMRGRAELREIIAALPKDALKPEIFRLANQQLQMRQGRETKAEREVIPEWADAETRRTELAQIDSHLANYGLSAKWLENQLDHRLAKYVRDQWKRAQHVERVLARVQPVKRQGTTSTGEPARKSTQAPRTATRDTAKLTRQVASLLSGDSDNA